MPKVLIVDDERLTTDLLESYLRMRGFDVMGVQRARDGIALAETEQPDIIVMDMMMPDISGTMACEMLRANPATQHIPIVVLSALYSLDSQEKARLAGADHYLPKNVPLSELAHQLTRLIAKGKPSDQG